MADTSPEDAAKYRQSFMKALSGHAGAVSSITRGIAGDPQYLDGHVEAIASLAAEMAAVFPEGSDTLESEALPAIWERPEDFAAAVADFSKAVDGLGEAAAGGDMAATEAAFREVGKACKGCHEDFRLKD
jgi:cytochrome c556